MPSNPTFAYEQQYWQHGLTLVAGVDEVGMGALAGPVVAAAVIFDRAAELGIKNQELRIRDSKTLSAKQREQANVWIQENALAWSIGEATVAEITTLNIRGAAHLAMQRAVAGLTTAPEVLLIDGNAIPKNLPAAAECIVKGDSKSWSIAAASILAKVHRDTIMTKLDEEFPHFGFAGHKGYGSAAHLAAIRERGPCIHHRPAYAPIKAILNQSFSS